MTLLRAGLWGIKSAERKVEPKGGREREREKKERERKREERKREKTRKTRVDGIIGVPGSSHA